MEKQWRGVLVGFWLALGCTGAAEKPGEAPLCQGEERAVAPPLPTPRVVWGEVAVGSHFSGRLGEIPEEGLRGRLDLDEDGAFDCWEARYEGGSGFGGVLLTVLPGCKGTELVVDTAGSFGSFLSAPLLSSSLAKRPALLDGIIELLYGRAHLRVLEGPEGSIDGSLRWLLDFYLEPALPAETPFAERHAYHPVWTKGLPTLPESQVVLLEEPRYLRVVEALSLGELPSPGADGGGRRSPFALLAYYAHNHRALREAGGCDQWRLFTTAHGVAVYDEIQGDSSWVYLSTEVEKLRWDSIGQVRCGEGLVLVERQRGGRSAWIAVDPVGGRFGLLEEEPTADSASDLPALSAALAPPRDWTHRYDLDGDGVADEIEVSFSGGAHCCYSLTIVLSSGRRYALPVELDGGYIGGLSLDQPERFNIADEDGDGLLDLLLNTENGEPSPLPAAWLRYGLQSHRVALSFPKGKLSVRDQQ